MLMHSVKQAFVELDEYLFGETDGSVLKTFLFLFNIGTEQVVVHSTPGHGEKEFYVTSASPHEICFDRLGRVSSSHVSR